MLSAASLPRFSSGVLLTGLALLVFDADATAQDLVDPAIGVSDAADSSMLAATSRSEQRVQRQRAVLASIAMNSAFKSRVGSSHRNVAMVALRRLWRRNIGTNLAFDYVIDLVPLVVSTNNPNSVSWGPCGSQPSPDQPQGLPQCQNVEYGRVYGVGILPIGLQVVVAPRRNISVTIGGGMGAILFNRPVPDPAARRFNFLGEVGGGLEVRVAKQRSLLVGYRRSHTSNAGTAEANPGLDAGMAYFGFGTR